MSCFQYPRLLFLANMSTGSGSGVLTRFFAIHGVKTTTQSNSFDTSLLLCDLDIEAMSEAHILTWRQALKRNNGVGQRPRGPGAGGLGRLQWEVSRQHPSLLSSAACCTLVAHHRHTHLRSRDPNYAIVSLLFLLVGPSWLGIASCVYRLRMNFSSSLAPLSSS